MNKSRYEHSRHSAAHRRRIMMIGVALVVASTSCGSGATTGGPSSDEVAAQAGETGVGDEPASNGSVEPGSRVDSALDTEPVRGADGTDVGEGGLGTEEVDRPASGWDGPDVVLLADAAIARLGTPIGQPYSAEAVVGVFAMPDDFLVIEGTIIGMFEEWDLDVRDGDISQEMIVGTDAVLTMDDLKGFVTQITETESFPWKAASTSDGGSILTGLYTSRTDPDPVRRLVLQSYLELDPARAPMNWELKVFTHTEIIAPDWVSGLPIPDGGTLTRHSVGVGQVESFGTTPGGGLVSVTYEYPQDALAGLEAYFATDVLEQAGFSFEDTPFNNQKVRIDLSIGEWAGRVSVWKGSAGDVIYYGVTWTLSKPAS